MRFGLRLIIDMWHQLAEDQLEDKHAYQEGCLIAVNEEKAGVVNIRTMAADIVIEILADAPWGLKRNLPQKICVPIEPMPTNVTLREMQQGVKQAVEHLSGILREDGTEDLEHSDDELSEEEAATPKKKGTRKSGRKASKTQSKQPQRPTSSAERDTKPKKIKHLWSIKERLELRKLDRDLPRATDEEKAAELARRMAKICTDIGLDPKPARTAAALTLKRSDMNMGGYSIEVLEAELKEALNGVIG